MAAYYTEVFARQPKALKPLDYYLGDTQDKKEAGAQSVLALFRRFEAKQNGK